MVVYSIPCCALIFGVALVAVAAESDPWEHLSKPRNCGDVLHRGDNVEDYYAVYPNVNNSDEAGLIFCGIEDGMIPHNSSLPRVNAKNCQELKDAGMSEDGVNVIYPYLAHPESPVIVFCDQTTLSGGWTVFQRRDDYDSQLDFDRSFEEYAQGFGNVGTEVWLGNDIIHEITQQNVNQLYVDLTSFADVNKYALYDSFYVNARDPEGSHVNKYYQMSVSHYSGTAGDNLSYLSGMAFTTSDADHDDRDDVNCALEYRKSGFWFKGCGVVNPNGIYFEDGRTDTSAAFWNDFSGRYESLKKIVMMVRPLQQQ